MDRIMPSLPKKSLVLRGTIHSKRVTRERVRDIFATEKAFHWRQNSLYVQFQFHYGNFTFTNSGRFVGGTTNENKALTVNTNL